jgi:hypothetical protein
MALLRRALALRAGRPRAGSHIRLLEPRVRGLEPVERTQELLSAHPRSVRWLREGCGARGNGAQWWGGIVGHPWDVKEAEEESVTGGVGGAGQRLLMRCWQAFLWMH